MNAVVEKVAFGSCAVPFGLAALFAGARVVGIPGDVVGRAMGLAVGVAFVGALMGTASAIARRGRTRWLGIIGGVLNLACALALLALLGLAGAVAARS